MAKKTRGRQTRQRDAPGAKEKRGVALASMEAFEVLCSDGYKPVDKCPEVQICAGVYASLISSMTICLMQNTDKGDVRIRNALSSKLDINPSRDMTRATFMYYITKNLLLHGNAVVIPVISGDGLIDDLIPVPSTAATFVSDLRGSYTVRYNGQIYQPDEILHFVLNPEEFRPWMGTGYTMSLRDAVDGIRQSTATKKSLMKSPAPSIIVKVDGLTEEFASADGRRALRKQYLDSSENGEPWFIPAEAFSVDTVKPLTMNDLAIKANLELDRKIVANVFGVPGFMVGCGEYKQDEYQYFLSTRVMSVAKIIEQELTKKLLYSDRMYWKLNSRSLYNYSLPDLINAGKEMVDRMAMRRNEWRDWLNMSPDPDMDELLALENYIPADRLGDQKKLNGGEENE